MTTSAPQMPAPRDTAPKTPAPPAVEPSTPHAGEVPPAGAACVGAVCITCADAAVEVTVVALEDDDLALVETAAGIERVSVMLVDATAGERILVHAGEAIGKVTR